MSEEALVLRQDKDGIARLTLNRPAARNALSRPMIAALQAEGKKVAMTWAYSPSYGKPLSVPQGIIGLLTRFGMDVVLAHPEGYEVMPEVEQVAARNAQKSGGSFKRVNSMDEAFAGADIVYPKSWASFSAMERRTALYGRGDTDGI